MPRRRPQEGNGEGLAQQDTPETWTLRDRLDGRGRRDRHWLSGLRICLRDDDSLCHTSGHCGLVPRFDSLRNGDVAMHALKTQEDTLLQEGSAELRRVTEWRR